MKQQFLLAPLLVAHRFATGTLLLIIPFSVTGGRNELAGKLLNGRQTCAVIVTHAEVNVFIRHFAPLPVQSGFGYVTIPMLIAETSGEAIMT